MAGSRKMASYQGNVGFHASYRNENGRQIESGVANALVGNYLTSLGSSAKTVVFATTAPPDKILWLTGSNKEAAGIDFEDLVSLKNEAEATPVPPSIPTLKIPRPVTAPLVPPTPLARGPRPLSNNSEWVSYLDFPEKALGMAYNSLAPDMALVVGIALDVNPSGRVSRCKVISSSGLPALDDATCRAVSSRAIFLPATGPDGRATAGRYSTRVTWHSPNK